MRVVRLLVPVVMLCLASTAVPEARQGQAVPLARTGWDALNAGRVSEATTAFDAALKLAPQQPTLLLGAGLRRVSRRRERRRRLLLDALAIEPGLSGSIAGARGRAALPAGDIDGAIDTYEHALVHAPGHPRLVQQLEAWRKEAESSQRLPSPAGQSLHSPVRRPGGSPPRRPRGPFSKCVSPRRDGALHLSLRRDHRRPVHAEQFHDITQSPDWAGGAYDGRIRVPVQGASRRPGRIERVLTHEFTHALVHSIAPQRCAVLARRRPCRPVRGQRTGAQRRAQYAARRCRCSRCRGWNSFATLSAARRHARVRPERCRRATRCSNRRARGDCQPARGYRQRRAVSRRRSSARCSSPTPTSRSGSAPDPRRYDLLASS